MTTRRVLITGAGGGGSNNLIASLRASDLDMAEITLVGSNIKAEILAKSPTSIKMLKFAFNLTDDGMVGQQVFAGEATRLAYMTEEAKEGRNAFLEKRKPNFKDIKWLP